MRRRAGIIGAASAALVLASGCGMAQPDETELTVFAASSLTEAADELLTGHEATRPTRSELVIGGSAGLAAQIRDGAPADVFLSADRRWADEVAAVCDPRCSVEPFASNSLVVAVPLGNPAGVSGLDDLARRDLTVVLCAEEVPCGRLGRQVTDASGVEPSVDSLEPSVRAVRTLLALGEADVGLVYATDVSDAIEVVADERLAAHRTVYFQVLLDGRDPAAASLVEYVGGPGQTVLAGLGFGPVPR